MKKLIIVGNKVIDKDISKEVESFDMIVRLNRMNNWGNTGTRTDLLLVDPHKVFFKLLTQPYEKYKSAKQILLNTAHIGGVGKLLSKNIVTLHQIKNAIRINIVNEKKAMQHIITKNGQNYINFSNFFVIVNYCIKTYSPEYQIWITGVDIKGRGEMFKTNNIWANIHGQAGDYEESILSKWLAEEKIHFLNC